jgi:hypothetical protein
MRFKDPVSSCSNRTAYVLNIKSLVTFFDTKFTLFGVEPTGANMVQARWTLALKPKVAFILPWDPKVVISGTANYEVDLATSLITSQTDTWDVLPSESFLAGLSYVLRSFAQVCCMSIPALHYVLCRFLSSPVFRKSSRSFGYASHKGLSESHHEPDGCLGRVAQ